MFTDNVIQKSGQSSDVVTFRLPSIISTIQQYTQKSFLDCASKVSDDMQLNAADNSLENLDGNFWEDLDYEDGDAILLMKVKRSYSKSCCRYKYSYKIRIFTVDEVIDNKLILDQNIEKDKDVSDYYAFRLEFGQYVEDAAAQMVNYSYNSVNPSTLTSEKIGDTSYTLSDVTSSELIYGYPQSTMSILDSDRNLPGNLNKDYYTCVYGCGTEDAENV